MGAPIGNQNARKGKWSQTVEAACDEEDPITRRRYLVAIAYRLRDLAVQGDMPAIREVGDRIDGKSKQGFEHTGADGEPLPALVNVTLTKPDA